MSWLSRTVKSVTKNPIKAALAPVIAGPMKGIELTQNALYGKPPAGAPLDPGYNASSIEAQAGITRPEYASLADSTGQLKSQFKIDPYQSEALQQLKSQALAQGPSAWSNLQTQQQQLEQQKALGNAQKMSMQGANQAQGMLARGGGLRGGASTLLARQAQRDLMNQGQNISGQGMGQRLGIQQQDLARKEGLLGKLGEMDVNAQQANVGALTQNNSNQAQFDLAKYKEQMAAWATGKSANAQRAAAGGGGKK